MSMFCYQCEQTAKCTGCTAFGVCGKDPDTATLQDLLVEVCKQISVAVKGKKNREADLYVMEGLFTTVTNVNFDAEDIAGVIRRGGQVLADLGAESTIDFSADLSGLIRQGEAVGIENRKTSLGDDITGLQELTLYGLKGTAAYADHAYILGKEDPSVFAFFHEALAYLKEGDPTVDALFKLAMKVGEVNLTVMGLLDEANTGTYGHPVPTPVRITPVKGKAILISGHDLKDLELLLQQTEGKGINIYTHGEMLPCHGYPELKKYKHLVGNYGGAWQDQRTEFEAFPGAILMTTNCIQKPKEDYKARIFTSGLVQWPGVQHIDDGNFAPVIEAALEAPGFAETQPEKTILVGFGHNAVLGVAPTVIEAVKSGALKHFFLIGGCDGAKPGRNYYTDFAEAVPDDCVILTLACGKYRFNKLDFGDIGGIPRLLDIGQCNDAYSAIQIAVALAEAFECGVNDLPLSMVLSWYEQKAVCILLTLLHLGIKNIKLGPSLPAFITPTVLNVLVEKFNIAPTTTAEADLKECLGE
ncbi:MAG: hydroxylamine reductase [Verrucomicrobiota bacterium]|nr:hydroxylamine reductase [Verrucomicrobiota bacterium]MDK2964032.1 hydroxylamine reductase [Verrucomicrobiota bacterium]